MFIHSILASSLILLVAVLHFWFMALEMFLWQKPLGLKTFRMSAEHAQATATLAANQGFYNGLFAAGLLFALWANLLPITIYILIAIVLAGIFGAITVSRKIFIVQSLPALLALLSLFI